MVARDEFVKASSKFEDELFQVEGFLKKFYNDGQITKPLWKNLSKCEMQLANSVFWEDKSMS